MLGVPVERWQPADFFPGWSPDEDWFTLAAAEHAAVFGRERIERGLDLLHPCTAEFLTAGLAVPVEDYLAARRRRYAAVRRLDDDPGCRHRAGDPDRRASPDGGRAGRSTAARPACSAPTSTPRPSRT